MLVVVVADHHYRVVGTGQRAYRGAAVGDVGASGGLVEDHEPAEPTGGQRG